MIIFPKCAQNSDHEIEIYQIWFTISAYSLDDTHITYMYNVIIITQMEIQDFKEPVLTDLRNLQHEKAQLEKVRINSLYINT